MKLLLIDNSNTRTKFCLADESGLIPSSTWIMATAELETSSLRTQLSEIEFDAAVLCSVVPKMARVIAESIDQPLHQVDYQSPLGIGIDYPNPEKIGADRLVNAAAGARYHGSPAIIVDFGTAVTFDIIDSQRRYAGGVIAPGLAAMSDYLPKRAALLPTINPQEPKQAIAKSTEEAMHAGAIFGYRGLVKEILAQISNELDQQPLVIATGGDAELISKGVSAIQKVEPNLTLQGLHLVGSYLYLSHQKSASDS